MASIAHVEAVAVALEFLERRAGATRQQVDGERQRIATGLAAATFVHRTSREGDPQLHTHCVVANLGRRPDGTYAALDAAPLYEWGKAAGLGLPGGAPPPPHRAARGGVGPGPPRMPGDRRVRPRMAADVLEADGGHRRAPGRRRPGEPRPGHADEGGRGGIARHPAPQGRLPHPRGAPGAVAGRSRRDRDARPATPSRRRCATGPSPSSAPGWNGPTSSRPSSTRRTGCAPTGPASARPTSSSRSPPWAPAASTSRPSRTWPTAFLDSDDAVLLVDRTGRRARRVLDLRPPGVGAAGPRPPRRPHQPPRRRRRPRPRRAGHRRRGTRPRRRPGRRRPGPVRAGPGHPQPDRPGRVREDHHRPRRRRRRQPGRPSGRRPGRHQPGRRRAPPGRHRRPSTIARFALDGAAPPARGGGGPRRGVPGRHRRRRDRPRRRGRHPRRRPVVPGRPPPGPSRPGRRPRRRTRPPRPGRLDPRPGADREPPPTRTRRTPGPGPLPGRARRHQPGHPPPTTAGNTTSAPPTPPGKPSPTPSWPTSPPTDPPASSPSPSPTPTAKTSPTASAAASEPPATSTAPNSPGPPGATGERRYAAGDRILVHGTLRTDGQRLHNGSVVTVTAVGDDGLRGRHRAQRRRRRCPGPSSQGHRSDGSPNCSHAWARTVDGIQGGTWPQVHLLGTAALERFTGYTAQSRGRHATHTWNVTRLPEIDHGGVLADQRTPEREVLDALRRQPDTGFAIHDAPGHIDTAPAPNRPNCEPSLRHRPPDRRPAFRPSRTRPRIGQEGPATGPTTASTPPSNGSVNSARSPSSAATAARRRHPPSTRSTASPTTSRRPKPTSPAANETSTSSAPKSTSAQQWDADHDWPALPPPHRRRRTRRARPGGQKTSRERRPQTTTSRDRKLAREDAWLDRVAEVAAPPRPGPDLGIDIGL